MLGFVGHNIDKLRVPGLKNRTGVTHEGESLCTRWAGQVTCKPVIALVRSLVVMAVLASEAAAPDRILPDLDVEGAALVERLEAHDAEVAARRADEPAASEA